MTKNLIIDPRFCGPNDSGNGGYVSGLLANLVDYIPEVTLHYPPPLSVEMVIQEEDKQLRLMHGEQLVATVRPGTVNVEAPDPPDFETATGASTNYVGFTHHPYPNCFVCGPKRDCTEALCIYPGKFSSESTIAAPWIPDPRYADSQNQVRNEFVWAALDCPGGIVVLASTKRILLGRMTAAIQQPIKTGEKCVVIGWLKKQEGRKYFTGTAIYSATQQLCAVAHAVWIDAG